VILARLLEPHEFAFVAGILGFLIFANSVLDLGVTTASTRAVARGELETLRNLGHLNVLSALVGAALAALLLGLMSAWSEFDQVLGMIPFVLWVPLERLAEFKLAVRVGEQASRAVVANLVVRKTMPLLTMLTSAAICPQSPVLFLGVGYLLGSTAVLATRGTTRYRSARRGTATRSTIRHARPFWLNSMAAQSRQLDVLIVASVGGATSSAAYAPVSRLISPLRMLPTSIAQAALSTLARKGEVVGPSPATLVAAAMIPSIAFFSLIAVWADKLISWSVGDAYLNSVSVLRAVLVGLVFASAASMQTSILQARGKESLVARLSVLTACFSLAAVAGGASIGGALGAAIGLSVGYASQCLALGSAVQMTKK
jgi:O-antigen/teichoic acid export membrane protein